MRIGSMCSGAAGLDVAVERAFGAETVWHCEKDAAASKVLAHRYPGVPNHQDLITTDWSTVEPIDILAAGWPCQPWSAAGKKLGAEDERAIWPYIAGAVRVLRPRIVCLENVPTVVRVGELQRVADSLSTLGYDLRWTCLRASEVGAPHRRERLFIVATDSSRDGFIRRPQLDLGKGEPGLQAPQRGHSDGRDVEAGGTRLKLFPTPKASDGEWATPRTSGRPPEKATHLGTIVSLLPTPNASDSSGGGMHPDRRVGHSRQLIDYVKLEPQRWGKYAAAIQRWENITRPAPAPTEPNKNGKPRLSAAFSEWMMGWPQGWVTDVPGLSRGDQLKIAGNGVVPQQAVAALDYLLGVGA